jgi:uncharacterized protein
MIKMTYRRLYFTAAMFIAAMMIVTGCAGTSKPSKFYLLLTLPDVGESNQATADSASPSVMVGPITLAAYLDRDQIVRRPGGNELTIDEFIRWGEPLQDNFYRVLIDNLSFLLNTAEIYGFNRDDVPPADFHVAIDVIRFDSEVNGDAYLTAFWTVFGDDGETALVTRKSIYRMQPPSDDVTGMVAAQNRTFTDFSREIASAIQSLGP